jgi:membrane protease YdiL (CAAX protease family)
VVFIILGGVLAAIPGVMTGLLQRTGEAAGWQGMAWNLFVGFGLTALIVFAWVRFFERRGLATIGFNGRAWARFIRGYLIGLAFLLGTVGIIALLGGYGVEAGGAFSTANVGAALLPIVVLLFGFIVQGSTEEILTRGWLMGVITSRHGLAWGIGLSSMLFGLLHAANIAPSPELAVGLVNIVLFGIFIGLYAAREGSLWGVCGWHAAWNWLLGLGFGLEVSGQVIETPPLVMDLSTNADVAWWITGAAFGPEGSVVTTVILLAGCAWIIRKGGFASHPVEEGAKK